MCLANIHCFKYTIEVLFLKKNNFPKITSEVSASSNPGQKATFSLCLPLNPACTLSSPELLTLITLLICESSINIHRL